MNEPFTLRGTTIWVTGGAGYLGSSITEALDNLCDKVICIDLGGKASSMVHEKNLTKTIPVAFDVTDAGRLCEFIEATIQKHGMPDGLGCVFKLQREANRL